MRSMTFYDGRGRPSHTVDVPDEVPVADLRSGARALHPSTRRG